MSAIESRPEVADRSFRAPASEPAAARTAMLLMVAFVGLWAAIEAIAGALLDNYSPFQVVWSRYAVHLAFMLAVWGWRDPGSLWRTRRPGFQLARSMLMLAMPASWVLGARAGLDVATLMSIFWLSPLLIMVLGHLFLGERAGRSAWLVCGAAFGGALVVLLPRSLPTPNLLLYPLTMAFSFSAYVVMTRSLRSEPTRVNLFYTAVGVFLALSGLMPHVWITPGSSDLLRLIAVGLLGYVALLALDLLAAAVPVALTAPLTYLQLVFGALITFTSTREMPRRSEIVGVLVIAAVSAYLYAHGPRRAAREFS